MSEPQGPAARLQAYLGDAARISESRGEVTVEVAVDRVLEALQVLYEAQEGTLALTDLTAVDRYPIEPRFEVVYQLTWYAPPARLRVKTRVPGEEPVVASVTRLWTGANWLEREVFDMFGIRFEGHPHLTRILMPDDWEGHPLRKDFPLTEEPVQFFGHIPKSPSHIIPKSPPRT